MCTQSGWGAPAREIIGNGWMKNDCASTAIQSGAWCNEYALLYESGGMFVIGLVLRNTFPDEIQKPGTNKTKQKRSMGK